jgi:hypothetical protein
MYTGLDKMPKMSISKLLKLSHHTPWRRVGKMRHSFYSFSTSAIDGGKWSVSRPNRTLAPGKGPPVPIVEEAEWASEPVWTQRLEEKSSCICQGSNFDRPVVHLVARHYTDWSTWLTTFYSPNWKTHSLHQSFIHSLPSCCLTNVSNDKEIRIF